MAQGGKGGQAAKIPQAGTNPYTNAAGGMQQAFNMVGAAAGQIAGMDPATYNPANMGATGYDAALMGNSPTIQSRMDRYQNPYEDQVVQSSADQVLRGLQQTQMGNADAARAAGAFGGGRHGVVEAVSNAEALRGIGDMTGQLRSQGFNTAAGLAGQDIANHLSIASQNQQAKNTAAQYNATNQFNARQNNQSAKNAAGQFNATQQNQGMRDQQSMYSDLISQLGNLSQASFGMGNSLTQQQQQQGNMSQQLLQTLLSSGQSGFMDLVSQPEKLLQLRLSSVGMNPLTNATNTTQQNSPGAGMILGNLLGGVGNMFQPIKLPFGG